MREKLTAQASPGNGTDPPGVRIEFSEVLREQAAVS